MASDAFGGAVRADIQVDPAVRERVYSLLDGLIWLDQDLNDVNRGYFPSSSGGGKIPNDDAEQFAFIQSTQRLQISGNRQKIYDEIEAFKNSQGFFVIERLKADHRQRDRNKIVQTDIYEAEPSEDATLKAQVYGALKGLGVFYRRYHDVKMGFVPDTDRIITIKELYPYVGISQEEWLVPIIADIKRIHGNLNDLQGHFGFVRVQKAMSDFRNTRRTDIRPQAVLSPAH